MRDLCHGLWLVHKGPFRLSCTLCVLKKLVVFFVPFCNAGFGCALGCMETRKPPIWACNYIADRSRQRMHIRKEKAYSVEPTFRLKLSFLKEKMMSFCGSI